MEGNPERALQPPRTDRLGCVKSVLPEPSRTCITWHGGCVWPAYFGPDASARANFRLQVLAVPPDRLLLPHHHSRQLCVLCGPMVPNAYEPHRPGYYLVALAPKNFLHALIDAQL